MTPQQIVGMAVRLFSIWLVIVAFQTVGIATAMNQQFQNPASLAMYAMPAIPLLFAIGLWMFPMSIAHKLVPKTHDTDVMKMPARDAVAAASAIIGIWVLVISVPQVIAAFGIFLQGVDNPMFSAYFSFDRKLSLFAVLAQALFGLYLVSRPWKLAYKIFPLSNARN